MNWKDAEGVACQYMRENGFGDDAKVTATGPDWGIDVSASKSVAQVKAWAKPVGSPEIQRLAGAAAFADAVLHVPPKPLHRRFMLFFTTGDYTPSAYEVARLLKVALYVINVADTNGDASVQEARAPAFAGHARWLGPKVLVPKNGTPREDAVFPKGRMPVSPLKPLRRSANPTDAPFPKPVYPLVPTIKCPKCGALHPVTGIRVGEKFRCGKCGKRLKRLPPRNQLRLATSSESAVRAPVVKPDWYPDPKKAARLRYWDGHAWTDHVAP